MRLLLRRLELGLHSGLGHVLLLEPHADAHQDRQQVERLDVREHGPDQRQPAENRDRDPVTGELDERVRRGQVGNPPGVEAGVAQVHVGVQCGPQRDQDRHLDHLAILANG